MKVYLLTRKKHGTNLSGKGASITGARWNSKRTEIVYTADSRALAIAEVVVHLSLALLPKDFVMLTIEIPDDIFIEVLDTKKLSQDWNAFPSPFNSQLFGDLFVRQNENLILKVPSAIVQGDFNLLINPFHKDFDKIKVTEIADFPFVSRNP